MVALEDHKSAHIRELVERFLGRREDEPARFHAAATLLAQEDAAALPALQALLLEEESVRVRAKVADGLAARAWEIPEADRKGIRATLPAGFAIDARGRVVKS